MGYYQILVLDFSPSNLWYHLAFQKALWICGRRDDIEGIWVHIDCVTLVLLVGIEHWVSLEIDDDFLVCQFLVHGLDDVDFVFQKFFFGLVKGASEGEKGKKVRKPLGSLVWD